MLYYHAVSNKYFRSGTPFTLNDVKYPATYIARASEEELADIGLSKVSIVGEAQDPKLYYTTEVLENGVLTITNTLKPQEHIDAVNRSLNLDAIEQLEKKSMLPRATRELLLSIYETVSAQSNQDPTNNFGYTKIKDLDTEIATLRQNL